MRYLSLCTQSQLSGVLCSMSSCAVVVLWCWVCPTPTFRRLSVSATSSHLAVTMRPVCTVLLQVCCMLSHISLIAVILTVSSSSLSSVLHAWLGVHSHRPPEWAVLRHVNCFSPCNLRTSSWSLSVFKWGGR